MQATNSIPAFCANLLSQSYVYILMGHEGSMVFAKVGYTSNLHARLHAHVRNCPSPPQFAACVGLYSAERARQVEAALHRALRKWRAGRKNEWYRFADADKATISRLSSEVLANFSDKVRPLKWRRISVGAVTEHAVMKAQGRRRRGKVFQVVFRRSVWRK